MGVVQIDVDIGSSSVARNVIGVVVGYITSLVVDMAVLIEVMYQPFISSYSVIVKFTPRFDELIRIRHLLFHVRS